MIAISVQDTLQCYAKKVQKVGTKLLVSFIVPESFGPSWRVGQARDVRASLLLP
jgi:hypothetical protein